MSIYPELVSECVCNTDVESFYSGLNSNAGEGWFEMQVGMESMKTFSGIHMKKISERNCENDP